MITTEQIRIERTGSFTEDLRGQGSCVEYQAKLLLNGPDAAIEIQGNSIALQGKANCNSHFSDFIEPCPSANELRQIGFAKMGVSGPSLGLI